MKKLLISVAAMTAVVLVTNSASAGFKIAAFTLEKTSGQQRLTITNTINDSARGPFSFNAGTESKSASDLLIDSLFNDAQAEPKN